MFGLQRGKKRVVEDSESEAEEQNGQMKLEKIDPIYLNQPINSAQGDQTARGLVAEYSNLRKSFGDSLEMITTIAIESTKAEVVPEDENKDRKDSETIKILDKAYRETLDSMVEQSMRGGILSDIKTKFNQGHQQSDIKTILAVETKTEYEKYLAKTARAKYGKSDKYIHFRNSIWEKGYGMKRTMPNILNYLPKEANDDESDDEIEIGAAVISFKCPLSITTFVNPVSSTKCTHKFSSFHIHDYIVKYVHANPDTDAPPAGFAPCPIAGCSVLLSKEDLAPDDFFAKRVADHLKKEKEDKANGRGRKDGTQYMTVVESDEDDE